MKLFYLLILFQKKVLNKKKNSELKNKIETLYLSIHLDNNKITKKLMSLLIPANIYVYLIFIFYYMKQKKGQKLMKIIFFNIKTVN